MADMISGSIYFVLFDLWLFDLLEFVSFDIKKADGGIVN
jgi:hypothetical protein